jgi:HD superfamily phosphohydrolase YqeK
MTAAERALRQRSPVELPSWAVVRPARRAHIERVTAMLDTWSALRGCPAPTRAAWHDAGRWHDALKDAPVAVLAPSAAQLGLPPEAWHGPAAADRLAVDGETRVDVLAAVRWHTVGSSEWSDVGRALYCADYLEPGRPDPDGSRHQLAVAFPDDPGAVFAAVVTARVERARRRGLEVHPRTIAMLEALR